MRYYHHRRAEAWTVRCSCCGASPGAMCHSIVDGSELGFGHPERVVAQNRRAPAILVVSGDEGKVREL